MTLLAKLLAMNAPPSAWVAFREGPRPSKDLARILALPRRTLAATPELAAEWTERLKRPEGTMSLRPIQAAALAEAAAVGGLLAPIGVGFGKSLLSLLLPVVWGVSNSVLLVPSKLRRKLLDFEYAELSKHWVLPEIGKTLHVVSYEDLSSAKRRDVLDRLNPDAIICDEGHALRHSSAARTKRFLRYLRSRAENPPHLAVLSGTLTAGSIRDYAHLAKYALREGSPLPLDWNTLQDWSYTLDAAEFPAPDGALRALCAPNEPVRSGFRRRLVETPGVVATSDNDPGMSLTFRRAELTAPPAVLDALAKLRDSWTRPDGFPLREAIEVYAASRQLASGFYYRTTFPRGEPFETRREWTTARKEYFVEVRERLQRSIKGQDSFLLLWRAAASGEWKSTTWARWRRIRKAVVPATETVWIDSFLVEAAVEWARKPGIVWVESEAMKVALAIAEGAGIPVYATQDDLPALMSEKGDRAVVCGINAFKEGVNIQTAFSRSLITTCPASNALLEQVIGRTHRPGQPADEVTVDFFMHTPEIVSALKTARVRAAYVEESTGGRQKLSIGSWLF